MSTNNSVPGLARLLFRAHNELSTLLGALPQASAFRAPTLFNLQLGGHQFKVSSEQSESPNLSIVCDTGAREYVMTYVSGKTGAPASLKAKMTDRATGTVEEVEGAKLLRAEVPESFKQLHADVMEQLAQWLPEKLMKQLFGDINDAAAAKPASAEASVKTEGSSTASNEALAEAEGQPSARDEDWQRYEIARENEPNIRFQGKRLAALRTPVIRGRWTEFHVYQTKGGKFIGLRLGRSMWLTEEDRAAIQVEDSLEALDEFFGHGALAKLLKQQLGMRTFVDIE